jgi:hypothetical protein
MIVHARAECGARQAGPDTGGKLSHSHGLLKASLTAIDKRNNRHTLLQT